MSTQIKISLVALVLLPALAVWFFWEHPSPTAAQDRDQIALAEVPTAAPSAPSAPAKIEPVATAVPEPSPPVSASAAANPPASAEGEVRPLVLPRNRPGVPKNITRACDPPYVIDSQGKHYKEGCR